MNKKLNIMQMSWLFRMSSVCVALVLALIFSQMVFAAPLGGDLVLDAIQQEQKYNCIKDVQRCSFGNYCCDENGYEIPSGTKGICKTGKCEKKNTASTFSIQKSSLEEKLSINTPTIGSIATSNSSSTQKLSVASQPTKLQINTPTISSIASTSTPTQKLSVASQPTKLQINTPTISSIATLASSQQTPQLKISQQPTQKLSIGSASLNHVLSDLTVSKIAGISTKTENQMSIASLAEQKHGSLQIFSKAQNDIVKIIADNGGKIASLAVANNKPSSVSVVSLAQTKKLSELSVGKVAGVSSEIQEMLVKEKPITVASLAEKKYGATLSKLESSPAKTILDKVLDNAGSSVTIAKLSVGDKKPNLLASAAKSTFIGIGGSINSIVTNSERTDTKDAPILSGLTVGRISNALPEIQEMLSKENSMSVASLAEKKYGSTLQVLKIPTPKNLLDKVVDRGGNGLTIAKLANDKKINTANLVLSSQTVSGNKIEDMGVASLIPKEKEFGKLPKSKGKIGSMAEKNSFANSERKFSSLSIASSLSGKTEISGNSVGKLYELSELEKTSSEFAELQKKHINAPLSLTYSSSGEELRKFYALEGAKAIAERGGKGTLEEMIAEGSKISSERKVYATPKKNSKNPSNIAYAATLNEANEKTENTKFEFNGFGGGKTHGGGAGAAWLTKKDLDNIKKEIIAISDSIPRDGVIEIDLKAKNEALDTLGNLRISNLESNKLQLSKLSLVSLLINKSTEPKLTEILPEIYLKESVREKFRYDAYVTPTIEAIAKATDILKKYPSSLREEIGKELFLEWEKNPYYYEKKALHAGMTALHYMDNFGLSKVDGQVIKAMYTHQDGELIRTLDSLEGVKWDALVKFAREPTAGEKAAYGFGNLGKGIADSSLSAVDTLVNWGIHVINLFRKEDIDVDDNWYTRTISNPAHNGISTWGNMKTPAVQAKFEKQHPVLNFVLADVMQGVGSSISFMIPGGVVARVAKAAGWGANIFRIGRFSFNGVSVASFTTVATTGAMVGSSSHRREFMQYMQSTIDDLKLKYELGQITKAEYDAKIAEIKGKADIAEGVGALTGTLEAIPLAKISERFFTGVGKKLALKDIINTIFAEGEEEAIQEFSQSSIQKWLFDSFLANVPAYQQNPITWGNVFRNAGSGFLVGSGMSAASFGVHSIKNTGSALSEWYKEQKISSNLREQTERLQRTLSEMKELEKVDPSLLDGAGSYVIAAENGVQKAGILSTARELAKAQVALNGEHISDLIQALNEITAPITKDGNNEQAGAQEIKKSLLSRGVQSSVLNQGTEKEKRRVQDLVDSYVELTSLLQENPNSQRLSSKLNKVNQEIKSIDPNLAKLVENAGSKISRLWEENKKLSDITGYLSKITNLQIEANNLLLQNTERFLGAVRATLASGVSSLNGNAHLSSPRVNEQKISLGTNGKSGNNVGFILEALNSQNGNGHVAGIATNGHTMDSGIKTLTSQNGNPKNVLISRTNGQENNNHNNQDFILDALNSQNGNGYISKIAINGQNQNGKSQNGNLKIATTLNGNGQLISTQLVGNNGNGQKISILDSKTLSEIAKNERKIASLQEKIQSHEEKIRKIALREETEKLADKIAVKISSLTAIQTTPKLQEASGKIAEYVVTNKEKISAAQNPDELANVLYNLLEEGKLKVENPEIPNKLANFIRASLISEENSPRKQIEIAAGSNLEEVFIKEKGKNGLLIVGEKKGPTSVDARELMEGENTLIHTHPKNAYIQEPSSTRALPSYTDFTRSFVNNLLTKTSSDPKKPGFEMYVISVTNPNGKVEGTLHILVTKRAREEMTNLRKNFGKEIDLTFKEIYELRSKGKNKEANELLLNLMRELSSNSKILNELYSGLKKINSLNEEQEYDKVRKETLELLERLKRSGINYRIVPSEGYEFNEELYDYAPKIYQFVTTEEISKLFTGFSTEARKTQEIGSQAEEKVPEHVSANGLEVKSSFGSENQFDSTENRGISIEQIKQEALELGI
ncbi:MAG: hypothetical protein QXY62_05325, partial [Candidatus Altiarchaeota archaeon]